MRGSLSSILIWAGTLSLAGVASADDLDVPVVERDSGGQMASCSSSSVSGLDENGDGFLAVRSGPGSRYRKIAELHNGDMVYVFDARGEWVGITYGTSDATCASIKTHRIRGKAGWVHSKLLEDVAG
jgi:hypothetical protein